MAPRAQSAFGGLTLRAVIQRVREAAVAVVEPPAGSRGAEGDATGTVTAALAADRPDAAARMLGDAAGSEREIARIGPGLLVLVGFAGHETGADLDWMVEKVLGLRVFGAGGAFERSVLDACGGVLVVSQFTLLADLRRGRRPDFGGAAGATLARPLYEGFVARIAARLPEVQQGVFGALMRVRLVNDGPATFVLDRGGQACEA